MAEGDLHRRAVSSAPRLSPEEIASRGFASATFRGISETDVRNFLRRVADEVAHTRERERELQSRVAELEERLRNPAPLTEQQLLDALGEETARVLRSAQEAAEKIRMRAEERSHQLVGDAQDEAHRLREAADEYSATRTREADEAAEARARDAEAHATETRAGAERDAAEMAERAARDTEAEIEAARTTGREMLAEARAVRERVLTDLARRRALVQAQIDELRVGRERLLESYRVVKRTLTEATEALHGVEAPTPEPVPEVTETAEAGEPAEPAGVITSVGGQVPTAGAEPTGIAAGPEAAGELHAGGDLDALFAKLRAQADEGAEPAAEPGTVGGVVDAGSEAPAAEPEAGSPSGAERTTAADAGAAGAPAPGSDAALIRARDDALAPVQASLARKAKRAFQDEQNELLDRVRKQRGRVVVSKVMPELPAQVGAWSDVLRPSVDAAYAAAYASSASTDSAPPAAPPAAPPELVAELAEALVTPLRERLIETIEDTGRAATSGDEQADALEESDVPQRIGARYREWKLQDLEAALGDALAVTWARAIYDAAPEAARLRWIAAEVGRCPDCDDNALEPTLRGQPFPTGQVCPPAHPGCRCLLAPAAADDPQVAGGSVARART